MTMETQLPLKLEDDAVYWKEKYEKLYQEYRTILERMYVYDCQQQLFVEIVET